MKRIILGLLVLVSFSASAQMAIVTQYGVIKDSSLVLAQVDAALALKLNTTGSAAALTNFPIFNQSTTGNASTATLASTVTTNANLTGDITSVGNATTLTTVNSTTGSFGNAASSLVLTANAKGQVTSVTSNAIQITESQVTSLVSDLAGKQATISLTTTGTGAATQVGSTINIPTPVSATNIQRNDESTGAATTTITLLHTAIVGTYTLFKNGVKLPAAKWSLSGVTVTLTDARVTTDIFSSDYNY